MTAFDAPRLLRERVRSVLVRPPSENRTSCWREYDEPWLHLKLVENES